MKGIAASTMTANRTYSLVQHAQASDRDAFDELFARSPNATSILLYRAAIKLKELFGDTESLSLPSRRLEDRGSRNGT